MSKTAAYECPFCKESFPAPDDITTLIECPLCKASWQVKNAKRQTIDKATFNEGKAR